MFLWLLAAFRAGGMFFMLPIFAVQAVPPVVRIALAMILGWMVVPSLEPLAVFPANLFELVLLVAKELSIGLMMGLAVRLIVFVLEMAAAILAVEIGLRPGPQFDPTTGVAGNPVGAGLFYLTLLFFFAGAHYAIIFAFTRSFELVPPGLQVPGVEFVPLVVKHTARIFQLGLLMAAPVIATNFLVNLTFSILGRMVPKLNVFILSFSVRIGAGLTMLVLSLGLISRYTMQQLAEAPELMLHFLPFAGF
jgi:flagellar biosynthetic protein FliR